MGGKALTFGLTERCDKVKFIRLSTKLLRILRRDFSSVEIPRYYHSKDSFGDIDILVSGNNIKIREYIEEHFSPTEIFHNDKCWSFDYERTQIDLIVVSSEHFDSTFNYYSFNDVGQFIGRIAQGFSGEVDTDDLF